MTYDYAAHSKARRAQESADSAQRQLAYLEQRVEGLLSLIREQSETMVEMVKVINALELMPTINIHIQTDTESAVRDTEQAIRSIRMPKVSELG